MKALFFSAIALGVAGSALGDSYSDVLEKSLMHGIQALRSQLSPREKWLAGALAVNSVLQPIAHTAEISNDFSASRGQVGPKPWSPVPPNYYAMFPPYIGATGGNQTNLLTFQSRCSRSISIKVRF